MGIHCLLHLAEVLMKERKERKFTLRLTTSQYQKLESYAKAHDLTMTKVLIRYIGRLPWKSESLTDSPLFSEQKAQNLN